MTISLDEILVFQKLITIGKPVKISAIIDELTKYHAPMQGVIQLGQMTVKHSLGVLVKAGLVVRPTSVTYQATWGTDADGKRRPALPLLAPALRERPRAIFSLSPGPDYETVVEGFLYPEPGSTLIAHTAPTGGYVGRLVDKDGALRIVTDSVIYDLAQLHKTKGYQIYRSAENHLQMAVRRLGWTLELREGRQPMCPCCETVMDGYGHQTCHVCNRLMTFREPDGPFCTGTVVTSPIHLGVAEHRPSRMPTQEWPSTAEAPASLWAASTALRSLQRILEAK